MIEMSPEDYAKLKDFALDRMCAERVSLAWLADPWVVVCLVALAFCIGLYWNLETKPKQRSRK